MEYVLNLLGYHKVSDFCIVSTDVDRVRHPELDSFIDQAIPLAFFLIDYHYKFYTETKFFDKMYILAYHYSVLEKRGKTMLSSDITSRTQYFESIRGRCEQQLIDEELYGQFTILKNMVKEINYLIVVLRIEEAGIDRFRICDSLNIILNLISKKSD